MQIVGLITGAVVSVTHVVQWMLDDGGLAVVRPAKGRINVVNRRKQLLNLILRGSGGDGGIVHIVPFYGPLPADREDHRYWGEQALAACGRKVRIRVAPTNLPSSAAEVAEKLNYMAVETWRKDDLAETCRPCLDRLDPELRGLLGLDDPVVRVLS
jgi:hypothetical protein